jgi:hypothetical protein
LALLTPFLAQYGFDLYETDKIEDRGYIFRAAYGNGHRRVTLHYQYSLFDVSYHIDDFAIDHKSYMDALGKSGIGQYPGFNENQVDGFRDVIADLRQFGLDFLTAESSDFRALAAAATETEKLRREQDAYRFTYRYGGEERSKKTARALFFSGDYQGYLTLYDSWKYRELITAVEHRMAELARKRIGSGSGDRMQKQESFDA